MDYRENLIDFIESVNPLFETITANDEYIDGEMCQMELHENLLECPLLGMSGDEFTGYLLTSTDDLKQYADNPIIEIDDLDYKVTSIDSRKQFRELCTDILRRTFDTTIRHADHEQYLSEINKYIKEFAKKLKNEWECFKDISLDSMQIYITSGCSKEEWSIDDMTNGEYGTCSKLITVYYADRRNRAKDRRVARHEVIHFMLDMIGLNCHDDSPVFWFFATVYDAHPYKELSETGKQVFDFLMKTYNTGGKKAIDKYLPNPSTCKTLELIV